MNRAEALLVLRKAVAYCPAMRTSDDTAAAWAEALAPYELQDGLDAVADAPTGPPSAAASGPCHERNDHDRDREGPNLPPQRDSDGLPARGWVFTRVRP